MAGVEVTEILFDPTKHAQIKTNLLGTGTGLAVLVRECPGVLSVQDLARLPNAACLALMKEWPEMPDKVYLEMLRKIKKERSKIKIKEEELREEESRQEKSKEESRQEKSKEESRQEKSKEDALNVDGVPVLVYYPLAEADSM